MVELLICNQWVGGSTPLGGSIPRKVSMSEKKAWSKDELSALMYDELVLRGLLENVTPPEQADNLVRCVFVIKRDDLFGSSYPYGLLEYSSNILDDIASKGFFIERNYAETHPEYLQVIPYCLFVRSKPEHQIFMMQRSTTGGEDRLHGAYFVGVGGHIDPIDDQDSHRSRTLIYNCAAREINEEIRIGDPSRIKGFTFGFVNDDTNNVGAVHVGIVCVFYGCDDLSPKSDELSSGEWVGIAEAMSKDTGAQETWCKHVLPMAHRFIEMANLFTWSTGLTSAIQEQLGVA